MNFHVCSYWEVLCTRHCWLLFWSQIDFSCNLPEQPGINGTYLFLEFQSLHVRFVALVTSIKWIYIYRRSKREWKLSSWYSHHHASQPPVWNFGITVVIPENFCFVWLVCNLFHFLLTFLHHAYKPVLASSRFHCEGNVGVFSVFVDIYSFSCTRFASIAS